MSAVKIVSIGALKALVSESHKQGKFVTLHFDFFKTPSAYSAILDENFDADYFNTTIHCKVELKTELALFFNATTPTVKLITAHPDEDLYSEDYTQMFSVLFSSRGIDSDLSEGQRLMNYFKDNCAAPLGRKLVRQITSTDDLRVVYKESKASKKPVLFFFHAGATPAELAALSQMETLARKVSGDRTIFAAVNYATQADVCAILYAEQSPAFLAKRYLDGVKSVVFFQQGTDTKAIKQFVQLVRSGAKTPALPEDAEDIFEHEEPSIVVEGEQEGEQEEEGEVKAEKPASSEEKSALKAVLEKCCL